MRILIAEDETKIGNAVASSLSQAGYVCEICRDGEEAWFKAETENYNGIVLDLGLPKIDGLTILRRWREAGVDVPVLILTARGAWRDRVDGIDAGADDYLAKPFQMEELVARIGALVRRTGGHSTPILTVADVQIDTRRMRVMRSDALISLTPLEFRMLRYLVHNKGKVISQSELNDHVYASDASPDSNALEVLLTRLRKKIGSDLIVTRRGLGYIIDDASSHLN